MKAAVVSIALACAACTVQPTPAPVYSAAPAAPADPAEPADPQDPSVSAGSRECHGNQTLEIVGETIEAAGTAVNAHGNCQVFISGSRIAGRVSLDLHGNAHATVEDSTFDGPVDLHGNATLSTSGSTYAGGIEQHGNAGIDDRGGNAF